jgi:hypothetical protein
MEILKGAEFSHIFLSIVPLLFKWFPGVCSGWGRAANCHTTCTYSQCTSILENRVLVYTKYRICTSQHRTEEFVIMQNTEYALLNICSAE